MKTNFFILAIAASLLFACKGNEDDQPITPSNADFVGTVSVTYQGEPFDNEDIEVNFTPSEDGRTASLIIYKIRFVPQMPVTIDVTIPDINVSVTGNVLTLTKDTVIPLAMGGEYPRYTVTGLNGKIEGEELVFSLNFGDYPTSFSGKRKP
ncbi:MAG: hypothetical protein IJ840_02345 [Bacteroidales bacterium]|nr:hypothetical protein [Bacteroidales bacterium]